MIVFVCEIMINIPVVDRAIKYVVEGLAVTSANYIPYRRMDLDEISVIALTVATSFAILDLLAPSISASTSKSPGFGIGTGLVGGPTLAM